MVPMTDTNLFDLGASCTTAGTRITVPMQVATQNVKLPSGSLSFPHNPICYYDNGLSAINQPTVTHWARMADYSALPAWLTFAPGSKTFSGQPTTSGKLYIIYGVTVTYPGPIIHESISTFIVNVQNTVATLVTDINSASPVVGSNYTLQFDSGTFVDIEGDTLYYFAS